MYEFIETYANTNQLTETRKALPFAREKHEGQFRKGLEGQHEPYINHPIDMACHAIAMGLSDDRLLAAILLHDVCEDCDVAPKELPVSEEVREAVCLVTKEEGYRKDAYFRQIEDNPIASMVKLIDRCHNVSHMALAFSREKLGTYIAETRNYVLPLLEKVMETWPEYQTQCFLLAYQMNSVLQTVEALLEREDL